MVLVLLCHDLPSQQRIDDKHNGTPPYTIRVAGRAVLQHRGVPLCCHGRYNGCLCEQYTVPNRTDCTRVSLDFRVIPHSLFKVC